METASLLDALTQPFRDIRYPMTNPVSRYLEGQGQRVKGAVGNVIRNNLGGGMLEAAADTGLQMAPFTPSEFALGIGSAMLGGAPGVRGPKIVPANPARSLPSSLLQEIIERSGGEYKGIQDFGNGQAKYVLFNEPRSGSTTGLMLEEVTPKTIMDKLAEVRGRFNIQ